MATEKAQNMEAINITISRTSDETLKAWLAFSRSSPTGKFWRRFRFPIFSVLVFLFLIGPGNLLTRGEASRWHLSWESIVLSLAAGWFISAAVKVAQENRIAKAIKDQPAEYFGEISITLDQTGVSIYAPLFQVQYNWKLLDSILVTPEYLFICSGKGAKQRLVVWIPVNVLGSQSATTLSNMEIWLIKSKEP